MAFPLSPGLSILAFSQQELRERRVFDGQNQSFVRAWTGLGLWTSGKGTATVKYGETYAYMLARTRRIPSYQVPL